MNESTPERGILWLGAAELARAIAQGGFSAVEAVEAHIGRVGAVNPKLNAVVWSLFESARAEAVAADKERAHGRLRGPLHGVPISVKESFDVAGTPTTAGCSDREGHRAASDAALVGRLRKAGAIVLGKTNVPQLLMSNESDNPLYGRANNPWDLGRAPGGSSGGEGALVAVGGSALGLGSDIGGSVRFPAAACGIHALKPTSGRLTMQGHAQLRLGQEAIVAQPGPLARRVADLKLAMEVLAAPGLETDPSQPPAPPWPGKTEVRVQGLRIGFYTDNGVLAASPALRRAVLEAAVALRERGAEVEEWAPPDMRRGWAIYLGLLCADGMAGARRALGRSRRDWRTREMIRSASLPKPLRRFFCHLLGAFGQRHAVEAMRSIGPLSAGQYWDLVAERNLYRETFLERLDAARLDALICPPDAVPALLHGASYYLGEAISYCAIYNLLGLPAGVVAATRVRGGEESDRPANRDLVERTARKVETGSAGLPVGVQVVARHWREDVVLGLMEALEDHFRAQPDYPQQPPI